MGNVGLPVPGGVGADFAEFLWSVGGIVSFYSLLPGLKFIEILSHDNNIGNVQLISQIILINFSCFLCRLILFSCILSCISSTSLSVASFSSSGTCFAILGSSFAAGCISPFTCSGVGFGSGRLCLDGMLLVHY